MGAARTKNSYVSARYRRLAARHGEQRAQVAVGASILQAAWHILANDLDHADLAVDYYLTRVNNRQRKIDRLTNEPEALGYHVTLTTAA